MQTAFLLPMISSNASSQSGGRPCGPARRTRPAGFAALFSPTLITLGVRRSLGWTAWSWSALLCFVVFCTLYAALALPHPAAAQNKQKNRGSAQQSKIPPGRSRDQANALLQLKKELHALRADKQKAAFRHNWDNLCAKIAKQRAAQPQNSESWLLEALCLEEIARHSVSAPDFQNAAEKYGLIARRFPQKDIAPQALLKQTSLLAGRGKKPLTALKTARQLIRRFPDSKAAREAQKIIAEIRQPARKENPGTRKTSPAAAEKNRSSLQDKERTNPTTRETSGQASSLLQLKKELHALRADKQKAAFRHNWDNLCAKIAKHRVAQPHNSETWLLEALCLEEIAHHSVSAPDFQNAAGKYGLIARRFPQKDIAPQALLKQTSLLAGRGKKPLAALKTGQQLIRRFPDSKAAREAQKIMAEIRQTTSKKDVEAQKIRPIPSAAAAKNARPNLQGKEKTKPKSGETNQETPKIAVSRAQQLGLTVKRIMIDPGHGGKDPGAQAGAFVESRFALAMSKRIGTLLAQKNYTILYTRTTDDFMPLETRPLLANEKKADLFISIHANAHPDTSIHGLETYYLDTARTEGAALVAARENAVTIKNISDLQFILADLLLSTKLKESRQLAALVQRHILQRLSSAKIPLANNGVRSAPFYVLMGAKMPAILIEFAYASNPNDLKKLQSERFLQAQAEGVVQAVLEYTKNLEKKAVPSR